MSTIKCHIDRREIDRAIKLQRKLKKKITLVDNTGLRLAINNTSASWNVNFRKRRERKPWTEVCHYMDLVIDPPPHAKTWHSKCN